MTRVPAALAVLLLAGSGVLVKPATLRQWRARGHLSKGDGYDLDEIAAYVETRRTISTGLDSPPYIAAYVGGELAPPEFDG